MARSRNAYQQNNSNRYLLLRLKMFYVVILTQLLAVRQIEIDR